MRTFFKIKIDLVFMKFQNVSPKNIKKNSAGRKRNTDINGFEVVWPHVFNWNLTPVLCTGQKWYQCILFQLKLKFLKHVFIFLKNATFLKKVVFKVEVVKRKSEKIKKSHMLFPLILVIQKLTRRMWLKMGRWVRKWSLELDTI